MVIVDDTGTIRLVNAQTEALFGYRREELLATPSNSSSPTASAPTTPNTATATPTTSRSAPWAPDSTSTDSAKTAPSSP
ncbi:PAS domain S-box protein [Streptomyces olivaceoviridis]